MARMQESSMQYICESKFGFGLISYLCLII